MQSQHQANGVQLTGTGSGSGPTGNMSQQDLNSIVSDELFFILIYSYLPIGIVFVHISCSVPVFIMQNLLLVPRSPTSSFIVLRLYDLLSVSCSEINQKQIWVFSMPVLEASTGGQELVHLEYSMFGNRRCFTATRMALKQGQHLPLLPH